MPQNYIIKKNNVQTAFFPNCFSAWKNSVESSSKVHTFHADFRCRFYKCSIGFCCLIHVLAVQRRICADSAPRSDMSLLLFQHCGFKIRSRQNPIKLMECGMKSDFDAELKVDSVFNTPSKSVV